MTGARRDWRVWAAAAVAVAVRAVPLREGRVGPCLFDECTYQLLAVGILEGRGLTESHDWLWAPGYPYLLAAGKWLSGGFFAVVVLQVALAAASVWLIAGITRRVAGVRAARVAAWLFALNPTLAFFATRSWSESVYVFLLLAAVAALLWSLEGGASRALLPGVLAGVCALFRGGTATYLAPLFAVAMVWPSPEPRVPAPRRRVVHALLLLLAAAATVAPYATRASLRHGGLVISDATLGQMMWLGNNDFAPICFDYGMRQTVGPRATPDARPRCPSRLGPVDWNACEVRRGLRWIRANPGRFIARIPLRVAQLVNPNSFLTRHIRTGRLGDVHPGLAELLVAAVLATSFLILVGGSLGAWARASGPYGLLAVATVVYNIAAVAALAGLTRYRLPLEPLWTVYAAALLAHPRATWSALRSRRSRTLGFALTLVTLVPLMLWFLPKGYD